MLKILFRGWYFVNGVYQFGARWIFVHFSVVSICDDFAYDTLFFIKSLFSEKKNRLCFDQEQEIFFDCIVLDWHFERTCI